ncbi:MAG: hypothetical protein L0Y54_00600 [Sporichthyaceae bacterium]|nr:hypothetical protein [Sporichthyaceae bacterium]
MPLTSKLAVSAVTNRVNDLALSDPADILNYVKSIPLANGTGANQADRDFHKQNTLAASATEDLDLAGGLVDAFGAAITFARVKALVVAAAVANVNNVEIGGAGVNSFINWVADATDKIRVRPGGVFALFAPDATGYPVTPATGDLLRIGNGGAGSSVTYDVIIIGSSV